MRCLGRLLGAAALGLLLTACDAWSESDPDIVDIATPSAPEFALVFQPTGVTLQAEVDGSVPDPRPPVSMGPDGRLVVPTSNQGVAIWSDDGRHLESVGRRGEGPGEFGASPLPVFDGTGNLHVFDPTQGAWHRFDESAGLISSVRSEHLAQVYLPGHVAVLGLDSVLTSTPSPNSNPRSQFRILTADGESTRFGAVLEGGASALQARPIALTDRGTFWAGPPQGSDEYVIEEWSLDGTLLRSIRREPPWGELDRSPGPNPMPRFPMLALGPDAEIIIMAVVSVPEDPISGGTIEVWYEVAGPRQPRGPGVRTDARGGHAAPAPDLRDGTALSPGLSPDHGRTAIFLVSSLYQGVRRMNPILGTALGALFAVIMLAATLGTGSASQPGGNNMYNYSSWCCHAHSADSDHGEALAWTLVGGWTCDGTLHEELVNGAVPNVEHPCDEPVE